MDGPIWMVRFPCYFFCFSVFLTEKLFFRFDDTDKAFQQPTATTNAGLTSRRQLFLSEDGKTFDNEWVPFCGRLCLDAESIRTGDKMPQKRNITLTRKKHSISGIAPGVRVGITLDYSTNDFRLLSLEKDPSFNANNIVFEITDAHLIVPIGQFHPKVRQLHHL